NVGDIVPVLAAEAVPPPRESPRKEPRPAPKPAWQEPPPVRKRSAAETEAAPVGPPGAAPAVERPSAPGLDWGPLGEFFGTEVPPAPASAGPASGTDGLLGPGATTWAPPPVRLPGLAAS